MKSYKLIAFFLAIALGALPTISIGQARMTRKAKQAEFCFQESTMAFIEKHMQSTETVWKKPGVRSRSIARDLSAI